MAFLDKLKGVLGNASIDTTIQQHAPEISHKIVSALGSLLEKSSPVLYDNAKYRDLVATPLFMMLPPPIQLLGRDRIKWDPIMLDVRDEAIVADGGSPRIRPDAIDIVVAIVRRHFAGQPKTA